jgi:hypothetical protein
VRKLFGGSSEVDDPGGDLYGWPAGQDLWHNPGSSHGGRGDSYSIPFSSPLAQYVTVAGEIVPENPSYDRPNVLVGLFGRVNYDQQALDFYTGILDELEKLARAHGIQLD